MQTHKVQSSSQFRCSPSSPLSYPAPSLPLPFSLTPSLPPRPHCSPPFSLSPSPPSPPLSSPSPRNSLKLLLVVLVWERNYLVEVMTYRHQRIMWVAGALWCNHYIILYVYMYIVCRVCVKVATIQLEYTFDCDDRVPNHFYPSSILATSIPAIRD